MKFFTQKDLDEATSKLESAIEARAIKTQLKIEARVAVEAAHASYSKAMDAESEATDAVFDARGALRSIQDTLLLEHQSNHIVSSGDVADCDKAAARINE